MTENMVLESCPYCTPTTAGHAPDCPFNSERLNDSGGTDASGFGQPQMGWQCPRCHKVHAPWVSECDCQLGSTSGLSWEDSVEVMRMYKGEIVLIGPTDEFANLVRESTSKAILGC